MAVKHFRRYTDHKPLTYASFAPIFCTFTGRTTFWPIYPYMLDYHQLAHAQIKNEELQRRKLQHNLKFTTL